MLRIYLRKVTPKMDTETPNTTANPSVPANPHAPAPQELPAAWPGAFGVYRYSRDAVRLNLWLLVQVVLIALVASVAVGVLLPRYVANLVGYVIGAVVGVAAIRIILAGVRGRKLSMKQAFGDNLTMMAFKLFVLDILIGFTAIISILLFIVPFFFVYPRLLLARYYLIDKDMDIDDAYKASWHATKGNLGKVWGIVGASLLMGLLVLTVIGIPVAIYLLIMYSSAFAVLYTFFEKHHQEPAGTESANPVQPANGQ